MSNNLQYQIYFDCKLETKEKVYSFISEMECWDEFAQKEQVIQQLNEREKVGSIQIAEHVILPHIESEHIKQSQLVFIRLSAPISSWSHQIKDIHLIIMILLKENESVQAKEDVVSFIRTLADEEYVNRLVSKDDKEIFYQEVKKVGGM